MNSKQVSGLIQLKREHEKNLLTKRNVLGCGVGFKQHRGALTAQLALVLYVVPKCHLSKLAPEDRIPSEIEGFPTDTQPLLAFPRASGVSSIGDTAPSSDSECLGRQKQRCLELWLVNMTDVGLTTPVTLEELKAATAACGLFEKAVEEQLLQKQRPNFVGEPGDSIGRWNGNIDDVYPGAMTLMRTIRRMKQHNRNRTDTSDHIVPDHNMIPGVGVSQGVSELTLGSAVQKRGRTTRLTKGRVTAIDVSIFVDYPIGIARWQERIDIGQPILSPSPLDGGKFPRDLLGYVSRVAPLKFVVNEEPQLCNGKLCPKARALFVEQIAANLLARPGDSGSLVVDEQRHAVGLLFAATRNLSFFNPIGAVCEVAGVDLLSS